MCQLFQPTISPSILLGGGEDCATSTCFRNWHEIVKIHHHILIMAIMISLYMKFHAIFKSNLNVAIKSYTCHFVKLQACPN